MSNKIESGGMNEVLIAQMNQMLAEVSRLANEQLKEVEKDIRNLQDVIQKTSKVD